MPVNTDNATVTINGIDLSTASPGEIDFNRFTDGELNALGVAAVNTAIYYNNGIDGLESLTNGLSILPETLIGALAGSYNGLKVFGLPSAVGSALFNGGTALYPTPDGVCNPVCNVHLMF